MPDHLDRQPYGQSFSSVPEGLVSEYRYGPTPDGPVLPRSLKRPRRSSPRLQTFDYTGPYAYSLTLNAERNRPHFTKDLFVRFSIAKLLDLAAAHKFEVLAYCFMPNHVHVLVKGLTRSSRLKPFMQQFKQALGIAYKTEHGAQLWHRSYHDHVARTDEDLERAAAYIWANPVRAALVERIEDYPWSGPRERIESNSGRSPSVRNVKPNRSGGGQSLSSVPTNGPSSARNVGGVRNVVGQSLSSVPTEQLSVTPGGPG
ncbi:MAG TPA: transposase [Dehalococcoidia bacterium]|nr:transposase [Dehalococcoidia bacterium]